MKSTRPRPGADRREQSSERPGAETGKARASLQLVLQRGRGIAAPPASRAQIRRWILSALSRDASLTLRFVNRPEARALNMSYRGRDYAPDVLTFVYEHTAPLPSTTSQPGANPRLEADIVLCLPVLREQAVRARWPFEWRLAHLVVHGVLHAEGYDHEHMDQARLMQALEARALRRFGIPDPYDDHPVAS